jgi:hypothetical protein
MKTLQKMTVARISARASRLAVLDEHEMHSPDSWLNQPGLQLAHSRPSYPSAHAESRPPAHRSGGSQRTSTPEVTSPVQ